jgi:hypothetical protein
MRGKIIEFVSRDCVGCNETAESLRDHICFSTPWYIHCSDYWDNVLQDLELTQLPKETLLKYFTIVSEIDPVEVDPENGEIILKMVIETGVLE